ncbi:MAG: phosphoenolpyruvate carboxykinase (ATP) [Parvularculaceae bacterium]
MPRHPSEYGKLLGELIERHDVTCWLVNTGWTGGPYGEGSRMPIKATRALLSAALDGSLKSAPMRRDETFGFDAPTKVAGVDDRILNPRETWRDPKAYDEQAAKLAKMFVENFAKFEPYVSDGVKKAAPKAPARRVRATGSKRRFHQRLFLSECRRLSQFAFCAPKMRRAREQGRGARRRDPSDSRLYSLY